MGRVSLARRPTRVFLKDELPAVWRKRPAELVDRLMSGRCELCKTRTEVEVHHIRRLNDLHNNGKRAEQPDWVMQMASRRRKTLVVCRDCHDGIHNGFPPQQVLRNVALESDVR